MEIEINVPLQEAPSWMEGLIFSREGDDLRIELRKRSGEHYGVAILTSDRLQKLLTIFDLEG